MPSYLSGITRPPSSGSGVGLGQAYHEKGFIRLAFGLGFDKCGAGGDDCYGFSYSGGGKDNSVTIRERVANSGGNGTEVWSSSWSSLDYDYISTTGNGHTTNGVWYLGKDQNIQQSDGQHEYHISVSVTDSHDKGNGGEVYWIPSPAPPPGPYVVVKNKSGHFAPKDSTVTIEINCFSNPDCSGENATHVMISSDHGPWANSNTFPHTETFSGNGLHNIKVKGVANTIIGKPIDYSFSIGDNDWRAVNLTPSKGICFDLPDAGKPNSMGLLNLYSENAEVEEVNFIDILGFHECTANANTQEIIGEGSSAYSYTRTGAAIAGSAQSQGGWEWFEIYPDKIVGDLALGYADWLPDSIWMNIKDTTDNTSQAHSFAPPNSPWFSTSSRTGYSGAVEVEIPYTFKDGHSYEMEMYGDNQSGGHTWPLHSAGPDYGGKYTISNLSLNIFKLEVSKGIAFQTDPTVLSRKYASNSGAQNTLIHFASVCNNPPVATDLDYLNEARTKDFEVYAIMVGCTGMRVYDQCMIPDPVLTIFSMDSSPNANGEYEYTPSGLRATALIEPNGHVQAQHYYHIHYKDNDSHYYKRIPTSSTEAIEISPPMNETQIDIDIFNACGSKTTLSIDTKFMGDSGTIGGINTGGAASGTAVTIVQSATAGVKPANHSLIVVR